MTNKTLHRRQQEVELNNQIAKLDEQELELVIKLVRNIYLDKDDISEVDIAVKVNGKFQGVVDIHINALEEEARIAVLKNQNIGDCIAYKTIKKIIYVANQSINFIVDK